MNIRLYSIKVMAVKRLKETFYNPAVYLITTLCLFISITVVSEFIKAVDSDGINLKFSALLGFIFNSLSGTLGSESADLIFSQGPFLFGLYAALIPFTLYIVLSSVFNFGHEKGAGSIETLISGPLDLTACFLGSLVRDIILLAGYTIIIFILFAICCMITNLSLGSMFFPALILLSLFSIALFTYGSLVCVTASNAIAAGALYSTIFIIFTALHFSNIVSIKGYAQNIWLIAKFILQLVSPYYYWSIGTATIGFNNPFPYIFSAIALLVLSGGVVYLSHIIGRKKGVGV